MPPFAQIRAVGIAAKGGVEELGEVVGRIDFEPGCQMPDPIEDRFGSLPLRGQVLDDLAATLGVDDLDFLVDVQKDRPSLTPQPIGKVDRSGARRLAQPLAQIGRGEAARWNVLKGLVRDARLGRVEGGQPQAIVIVGVGAEDKEEQLARGHVQGVKPLITPGVTGNGDSADDLFVLVALPNRKPLGLDAPQEGPDPGVLPIPPVRSRRPDLGRGLGKDLPNDPSEGEHCLLAFEESGDGRRGDRRPSQRLREAAKADDHRGGSCKSASLASRVART